MQIAASILFFYVFGLLAVALTIYLAVTFYRFFKPVKPPVPTEENDK